MAQNNTSEEETIETSATTEAEVPENSEQVAKRRKKNTRRNSLLETVPVDPHSMLSGNIEEVNRLIVEAAARSPSDQAKELITENYSLIQGI